MQTSGTGQLSTAPGIRASFVSVRAGSGVLSVAMRNGPLSGGSIAASTASEPSDPAVGISPAVVPPPGADLSALSDIGCAFKAARADGRPSSISTAMVFWRSDTSNLSTPAMTEPPRMSVPYSAWVNLGNRCELIPSSPPFKGRCHCIKTQTPIPNVPRRISHFLDSPASMFTEIFMQRAKVGALTV